MKLILICNRTSINNAKAAVSCVQVIEFMLISVHRSLYLRGVLVEGGADKPSVHFGNLRYVPGFHSINEIRSPLAGLGRRPWARVDPPAASSNPNATLTVF